MEKVLLAIDGMSPDKKALQYTIQLCRRMKAELNVLQVINSKNGDSYISQARKKATHAKKYIEGSFAAIAFAEAGEHETADALMCNALKNLKQMLSVSENDGIRFHLTVKAGNLKREIIRYLKEHRDVVITIYDAHHRKGADPDFARKHGPLSQELQKALSTPLVVVQNPDAGLYSVGLKNYEGGFRDYE
jgi:nucleotide-binding universal stress UspA family protein